MLTGDTIDAINAIAFKVHADYLEAHEEKFSVHYRMRALKAYQEFRRKNPSLGHGDA